MSHIQGVTKPRLFGLGASTLPDPTAAVAEAVAELDIKETAFVLAFIPDHAKLDEIGRALTDCLPSTPTFGCTTAGQITRNGYEDDALLLIAFPRRHFRCASTLIKPLKSISIEQTASRAFALASRFDKTADRNRIALLFADGLSKQEDVLVATLEAGLGEDIPVFGGSAAHGLAFDETFVLHDGCFHKDAALLLVLDTDLTVTGLGFDHFLPTDNRMVVTQAVPEERLVRELNGSPAALEYARLVGCSLEDLSPQVFAENPVLVRNGNAWHVRAIQQVEDNHGLSFLSAIDDGLLLTLGKGTEILQTLEAGLSQAEQENPSNLPPDIILGFDCFLRKLEIEQKNLVADVSHILRRHRVLGFNTYGEQHRGVHVNQTFVGVAFSPSKPVSSDRLT